MEDRQDADVGCRSPTTTNRPTICVKGPDYLRVVCTSMSLRVCTYIPHTTTEGLRVARWEMRERGVCGGGGGDTWMPKR